MKVVVLLDTNGATFLVTANIAAMGSFDPAKVRLEVSCVDTVLQGDDVAAGDSLCSTSGVLVGLEWSSKGSWQDSSKEHKSACEGIHCSKGRTKTKRSGF